MMNSTKTKLAHAFGHGFATRNTALGHAPIKKKPVSLPRKKGHSFNTVSAYQTRSSCINTTALCAKAMGAAHYLAAAENQPYIARLWLRYVYDASLDICPDKKAQIKGQLLVACYGAWCFMPKRKRPNLKKLHALGVLFACVLDDAVATARHGKPIKTTTATQKCQAMGYGVGKAAYQKADYSRQYGPHEDAITQFLRLLDEVALKPVELINLKVH